MKNYPTVINTKEDLEKFIKHYNSMYKLKLKLKDCIFQKNRQNELKIGIDKFIKT